MQNRRNFTVGRGMSGHNGEWDPYEETWLVIFGSQKFDQLASVLHCVMSAL